MLLQHLGVQRDGPGVPDRVLRPGLLRREQARQARLAPGREPENVHPPEGGAGELQAGQEPVLGVHGDQGQIRRGLGCAGALHGR